MPMSKKYKDNVIPFPNLKEKQTQEKLKQSKEAVDFIANESIDTASYMMDVMESELQHMTESLFSRVKFRDPDTPESKDMFVILNLLNAMFHRYAGQTRGEVDKDRRGNTGAGSQREGVRNR